MVNRVLLILAIAAASSLGGCTAVEQLIDCNDICNEVETCAGDGFDKSECVDECEDQPLNEIDPCDACLDSEGMTCSDCVAECAPLLI